MRVAKISILSVFTCFSAFAGANLPVVNVYGDSVSARSAFGNDNKNSLYGSEPVQKITVAPIKLSNNQKSNTNDVLLPNKPNGDLWARSEKTDLKKISNIETSDILPEENIEKTEVKLDTEIAKLVDLQRKADEIKKPEKPTLISSFDANNFVKPEIKEDVKPAEIAVNKIVVPVESDVIVRHVKPELDSSNKFESKSDFAKLSPTELKKAFKKTYLSENKHLSTYQIDEKFDVASDVSLKTEGFVSESDLSESGGVRPLEIKIGFRGEDSALSRDNYNLLTEYASIIVSNPKRAIQVSIPQNATMSLDSRKLTARRLAIVEQVLRDTGVSDQRIMPVLSQRSDENFVLRVISSDQYETLTQQKRDMFGDNVGKKTYKSLSW